MSVILIVFQGDWSLYVEQLTVDELQAEVMEVLRAMYPNITVPEPIDIHMPAWHADPLYRGSYSNWGPSYVPAQSENLKATLDNRLWFAGEATSVKYFGLSSVQARPEMSADKFSRQVFCKRPTSRVKVPGTPSPRVFRARAAVNSLTPRSRRMRSPTRVF